MKKFLKLYIDAYKGLSRPAWMLAIVMLINRCGAMVLPFLGVYMLNELHFNLKETGIVLSFFGIGAMLGSLLGGYGTDKLGHFKIQLLSLLLTIPFFILLPHLKTVWSLAFGVLFLSIISESFRPANSVSIMHYSRPQNIVRSFSLNRMALNLGFSIGPALGGFLAAISYSFLFYGNAVGAFFSALVFYLYFRNRRGNSLHTENKESKKQSVSPYKDGPFLLYSLCCCLFAICFLQLISMLPLYYRQDYQMTEMGIGTILAYSGVVVFSLEMFIVQIAERHSSRNMIVLGVFLCALSFGMLILGHSKLLLYSSMFVLCIGEILALPFMATVTMQRSGAGRSGAYMGLNALTFSVAHIVSPFVGTRVAAAYGFNTLWAGTALLLIITSIGLFYLLPHLKKPISLMEEQVSFSTT